MTRGGGVAADVGNGRAFLRYPRALLVAARYLSPRSRELWPGFGEPLNGQRDRLETLTRLLRRLEPDGIIETGTFLGFTTAWLATFGPPVISIEIDPGYFEVARRRLRKHRNVEVFLGNSSDVLTRLDSDRFARPFFYLDAHWGEDLPLKLEVQTIFRRWPESLVVIDDFHVPHDPGYAYDVYGGVALTVNLLEVPSELRVAFPAARAAQESGARRGTVYLGGGAAARALDLAIQDGLLTGPSS